jgi:hypothetical protein
VHIRRVDPPYFVLEKTKNTKENKKKNFTPRMVPKENKKIEHSVRMGGKTKKKGGGNWLPAM